LAATEFPDLSRKFCRATVELAFSEVEVTPEGSPPVEPIAKWFPELSEAANVPLVKTTNV